MIKVFIVLMMFAIQAQASGSYRNGTNGMDGRDGTNGMNGVNGTNGIDGSNFNDIDLVRAISINAAMANIPTISHEGKDHMHTNIGVGVGGYDGENAIAIGASHMDDAMTVKGSVGFSGGEELYGVGVGWSF